MINRPAIYSKPKIKYTIVCAVKVYMLSFIDSLVAPLSLINALLAAVSMKRKDYIAKGLDQLEDLWGEYKVYSSNIKKKYL